MLVSALSPVVISNLRKYLPLRTTEIAEVALPASATGDEPAGLPFASKSESCKVVDSSQLAAENQ